MPTRIAQTCCAIDQITCGNYDTIEDIIREIQAGLKVPGGYARTSFLVIARTDEPNLISALQQIGFKEVVEFSRRKLYNQGVRLKMFFIEPEIIKPKVVVKRKVGRPKKDEPTPAIIIKNKAVFPQQ